jgi:hypothetical protein
VPLVLTVTNTGTAVVTLQVLGRKPTADFRISDAGDRPIWTRLRGQTMLGALRLYPLDSGRALVLRAMWDGRDDSGSLAPPGEYLIRGVLLTDDPGGLPSSPLRMLVDA